MTEETHTEDIAERLGMESLTSVVKDAEECCTYESQRIALVNEPRIIRLGAEYAVVLEEERELAHRLRHAPQPGILRKGRPAAYTWCIVIALTLAGFIFSLIAFDPYRLGWKSYVYSIGIAVVTPYLIDKVLEQWNARKLVRSFAMVAFVAAITSLVLLAVVRGDLLAQQFKTLSPVVLFEDAPAAPTQNDFYGTTLGLLRLTMALLAVAMELGAGLALHDAWPTGGDTGEDWERLRERLALVRRRLFALAEEISTLKNEPGIFAARFWRNFYRAMLTHVSRHAGTKLLLLFLLAFSLGYVRANAQEHVTVVAAVDLTQSVATPGPDGQTDFEKNIAGVTRLLARMPSDSRVVVIGITDTSFAEPYVLLKASIPAEPGYFGERLEAARNELVRAWKARAGQLQPQFRSTDILGALLLAGQLFEQDKNAGRRILLLFSDMRHHTADFDLESPTVVPNSAALEKTHRTAVPVADLRGVQAYVLGVDGAGKTFPYWQSLKEFWAAHFEKSGATLVTYSVLRDLPALAR